MLLPYMLGFHDTLGVDMQVVSIHKLFMPRFTWRHERGTIHSENHGDASKSMQRVPSAIKQVAKYPLVQQLSKIKLNERVQIVSPELCGKSSGPLSKWVRNILILFLTCSDDVIRRLDPSLKRYIGCDVIDINPGVCLWSTKIHEYLKPRRHILVEPLHDVYDQFLRPLVDSPGSRYTLADLSGPWNKWILGDYIAQGLLPEQECLAEPGLESSNDNTSLLVLANMARPVREPGEKVAVRRIVDTHYKVLEFVRALETRSGFHTKGLVRMLMWMIDHEKINLLPRTASSRRRLSVYNELYCNVEEIVGDVIGPHAVRREAYVEMQSSLLTAERMKNNEIFVPINRMDKLPRQLRSEGVDAVTESSLFGDRNVHGEREWHKEFYELQKGFADGSYSQFVGGPPGFDKSKRAGGKRVITPEYQKFQLLERTEKSQQKKKSRLDDIAKEDAQIRAKQLVLASSTTLTNQERASLTQELNEVTDRYKKTLAQQTEKNLTAVRFFADERATWSGESSLLLWDRRNAEPIVPEAHEFYSPKPLALLDFQPKPAVSPSLTTLQHKYLDHILLSFFTSPGSSVATALDLMFPGAAKAIIPNAPSLCDPRRGGRMDLDELRVRMLTPQMLREIAIAWDGWAFKPTLIDMSQTIAWLDNS